jgi:RNA polymerase sigma factor (sigma-70 family)
VTGKTRPGEHLLRELAPQVLGAVVRRFGDFSASEDAVQEALLVAAQKWPDEGVPENPRAWLIQVAARRITDQLRSELSRRRRETAVVEAAPDDELVVPALDGGAEPEKDDTLLLLFMCCHPALTRPSAIALTLRAVGGLTTAEIAHAFLVPEATMAQRISRAKQLIKQSGVGFRMPTEAERAERLDAVLHVLYLVQRGLRVQLGSEPRTRRSVERGHSPCALGPGLLAERRRGHGPARADAADRRAPGRPHGAGRRAHPAR